VGIGKQTVIIFSGGALEAKPQLNLKWSTGKQNILTFRDTPMKKKYIYCYLEKSGTRKQNILTFRDGALKDEIFIVTF